MTTSGLTGISTTLPFRFRSLPSWTTGHTWRPSALSLRGRVYYGHSKVEADDGEALCSGFQPVRERRAELFTDVAEPVTLFPVIAGVPEAFLHGDGQAPGVLDDGEQLDVGEVLVSERRDAVVRQEDRPARFHDPREHVG